MQPKPVVKDTSDSKAVPTSPVPSEDGNFKLNGGCDTSNDKSDDITNVTTNGPPSAKAEKHHAIETNGSIVPRKKRTSPIPSEDFDELAPPMKKPKEFEATEDERIPSPRFPSPPGDAATEYDKKKWQGWCVIESEPAYFSSIIHRMGVEGISVRQAFVMDIDTIKTLPQPIHGLILCYRYRESPTSAQADNCPDNVWFANQLPAQNSCGTLAMINILMNAETVELGEHLKQFKQFTSTFDPYSRGEAFASFDYVKRIHNSFAKKMDMQEDDKHLASKVTKSQKLGGRRASVATTASIDSIEDNALHFIAFLPIDGKVWKLDGMDAQPTSLGSYEPENGPDGWLEIACTHLLTMMTEAQDDDYSLLALVQSPLITLREELLRNVAAIRFVESCLDGINSDWRSFEVADGAGAGQVPLTPKDLSAVGLTQEQLVGAQVPASEKEAIEAASMSELLSRHIELIEEQRSLPARIYEEMQVEDEQQQKAEERQWDYGPVIKLWMEKLAANGYLEKNLDDFMPKQGK